MLLGGSKTCSSDAACLPPSQAPNQATVFGIALYFLFLMSCCVAVWESVIIVFLNDNAFLSNLAPREE